MATTTTNYGFDVPTSSDLVKNGATQIALLGQDLDTFLFRPFARNTLINGAFDFDQRNSGASFTPVNNTYGLDRWKFGATQAGKVTTQQVTSTIPGFSYSMKITSTSAYTPVANDEIEWFQNIETGNTSSFGWGTASGKTVTLSFWVKSSITGTFGGAINNNARDYSFPFSYTINAANTAEYKSVVITAPPAGTWPNTGTDFTVQVLLSLGAAGTSLGTANAWTGSFKAGVTGQTNLVSTNGATLEVTGMQLELGNQASPFVRAGGTIQGELAACQRYFQKSYAQGTAPATNAQIAGINSAPASANIATTNYVGPVRFPVVMRTSPSVIIYSYTSSTTSVISNASGSDQVASSGGVGLLGDSGFTVQNSSGSTINVGNGGFIWHHTANAEL
jgi:hypothetical protein